ncbi:Ammonium transporter AmtB-like protein [Nannochloropsis gaditana]|uniref:Ammonium transporter AmtB-like protein n=1 Tax=Nannochloropsis gaditana TaxID=72520 RepID=W7TIG5_9STRA|nr:Ammonium transporter AmtB-like protein [Nannochloropsis gaditana]
MPPIAVACSSKNHLQTATSISPLQVPVRKMEDVHGRSGLAFPMTLVVMQGLILVIWTMYGSYAPDAEGTAPSPSSSSYTATTLYQSWLGVHIMMLFGFGNLMTFMHRHGYSASGYTFLVTCLGLQWCVIMYAFWHGLIGEGKLRGPTLDMTMLFQGDFGVAAVLISFGALIGKISPTQLMVLCFLEIIVYAASEAFVSEVLRAEDVGGSMVIHTFGSP